MKTIRFVRLLRNEGMKFGYGIDQAGKLWGGFTTDWDHHRIYQEGRLGPVGLCFVCGGRVFSGWTCFSEKKDFTRDVCTSCILMPAQEKVFVTEFDLTTEQGNKDWDRLAKIFKRRPSFTYPVVS